MKIKNIKIKFNEGHLEHVNIVYNKKINKKQIKKILYNIYYII